MGYSTLCFKNVFFQYDSQEGNLFSDFSVNIADGWCAVIGGNGAGKTTLLKLAAGFLSPLSGRIETSGAVHYCPQTTHAPPEGFEELLGYRTGDAGRLVSRLGIGHDWFGRWDTLSFGERKRAQVAVALFLDAPLLAMDEPFNHLDRDSSRMIVDALKAYRGTGLLVCHQREHLNALCCQCLFLEAGRAELRKGRYGQMQALRATERAGRKRRLETEKQKVNQLRREVRKRKVRAATAHRERSKGQCAAKDHDAKAKINLTRLTGKDGSAGKRYRQLAGRLNQAEERVRQIRVEKEYATGFWLEGTASRRDRIVQLPPGRLPIAAGKAIEYGQIDIRSQDRIGIMGPNGAGKSFFLNFLAAEIGRCSKNFLHIPQELSEERLSTVCQRVRQRPGEELGRIMTIVRRLGSDPERLFADHAGSPGEIKKLMIAEAVLKKKEVILLDEPVNHLDILSVEALEEALVDYPGCLVVVSHDVELLATVATTRWKFKRQADADGWVTRIYQE